MAMVVLAPSLRGHLWSIFIQNPPLAFWYIDGSPGNCRMGFRSSVPVYVTYCPRPKNLLYRQLGCQGMAMQAIQVSSLKHPQYSV